MFLITKGNIEPATQNTNSTSSNNVIWEERLLALEKLIHDEKQRNNRLEAQLQETIDSLSSIKSNLSDSGSSVKNLSSNVSNSRSNNIDTPPINISDAKIIEKSNLPSDFGLGSEWSGFSHPQCSKPDTYALLQREDGNYTIINKSTGRGLFTNYFPKKEKRYFIDFF